METFHYPHFPPDLSIAHVALFTKVTNSAELRLRLIKAASLPGEEGDIEREAVNFAFIDATKISEALRRYGVSDTTDSILVVRIASPEFSQPQAKMIKTVSGRLEPLSSIESISDWVSIAKSHKINNQQGLDAASGNLKQRDRLCEVVLSAVATKGVS
ncbi:hypothetical protein NLI96_g7102 [Meripilus lineatus]|uniref:EKC/KEOPS complex subunit CGI121 n=1 Tax=Meripilus lineatus TaxID=2056292 RepID=A0AAD5V007_9APHY|nr:hypothetical protein NLI96_g7102 [Physisporinus lineatus]